MRGLEPDEREALLSAPSRGEVSPGTIRKLCQRGLICRREDRDDTSGGVDNIHYQVTRAGWLALRLDTAARRGVSA